VQFLKNKNNQVFFYGFIPRILMRIKE